MREVRVPPANTDAATIERAKGGDRKAQALLLRALQDMWFRMALSLLRDPELAQDAAQETGLRFLTKLDQYRGESSISTWSMGIAINVAREIRRKRKPTGDIDDVDPPSDDKVTPAGMAIADEESVVLKQAMEGLSHRQREVVLLRFFEEKSTEETAEAMGCAAGTVKATLHQALRALKKRIKQLA